MKKLSFIIVSILAAIVLKAQSPEDIFNMKFPECSGNLKIESNTIYNPSLKAQYRQLYVKLTDGLKEIEKFELGGANAEILQIFDLKDLKSLQKEKKMNELKALLRKEQNDIHHVMRGKEKYGADSVECVRNVSMFNEFFKQKNYKDAYTSWNMLFHNYPVASTRIYSSGTDIIENFIKTTTDEKTKQLWIDTLFLIYDQRIEFFGDDKKYGKGYILGIKGVDILRYRKDNVEGAYNCLMQSIEIEKAKSGDAIILSTMQASIGMYTIGKIDAATVVENFTRLSDILTERLHNARENNAKEEELKRIIDAIGGVETLFSSSTAATCPELVKAFTPRFEKNKDDIELLKKITYILYKKDCTGESLYAQASEQLYKLEPNASSAVNLARLFTKKEEYSKAIQYYDEAIKLETGDTLKAQYCYEAASIALVRGNYTNCRALAFKAADLKPGFGKPYLLVARAYAASSNNCGEDSFQQRCVYWVAMDMAIRAKATEPAVSDEANSLINAYSTRVPSKEDAFMYSITEGSVISIGCWINENTKARW